MYIGNNTDGRGWAARIAQEVPSLSWPREQANRVVAVPLRPPTHPLRPHEGIQDFSHGSWPHF